MATSEQSGVPAVGRERNHGLWIFVPWVILSLAADLVIWFVWYPHLPPGRMSDVASGQQFDIAVLSLCAAPVILFIWIYGVYAVVVWRRRPGDDDDGPPLQGNSRVSVAWIVGTPALVLGLFAFGTYRYPQFGGFETTELILPEGAQIQFNVTSLDVIHSFWAYQLGVKADANPGVNNVAFAKPTQLGTFTVRCSELCGLWHGAMFNSGRVVTPAAFVSWARNSEARLADVTKLLPPYALTYDPTVVKTLGPVLVKLGLTGAGGGWFGPQVPVQP
jgi:cytochrome c oxidase subunit II